MRLAIIAPLVLAAVAGIAPAALACPVDVVTGPVTDVINTIGSVLGLTTPPVTSTANGTAGGTVINNFTTNNFTTNTTTTDTTPGAAGGATTAAATQAPITLAASPLTGGGGGGVGGGGGGMGGFSGGSSGISGLPINPSMDFSSPVMTAGGGGGTGASGGAFSNAGGVTLASAQTPDMAFGSGSDGAATAGPLTAGVTLASLPAGPSSDGSYVGMASPRTTSVTGSGFGLEGPAAADDGPAPAAHGGMLLAGLAGVGVLGAGLAWKSLAV